MSAGHAAGLEARMIFCHPAQGNRQAGNPARRQALRYGAPDPRNIPAPVQV
jgi:hypothetical protein